MKANSCPQISTVIYVLVLFSLLFSPIFPLKDFQEENETSVGDNKLKNMKLIKARLRKINKPFVKSIKSADGDIIDCVLFHLQPAFDLFESEEKMSLTLPELPKGHDNVGNKPELKQLWNSKGESCPNGTIPIRRTSASDIVSFSKFKKKYNRKDTPSSSGHEHAIGYVNNGEFYGARAILNIWKPNVTELDFSLSQIWVLAELPGRPVNTLEAGWQIFPLNSSFSYLPRLFTYWTPDAYQSGCYNMLCQGFVQTSQKFSLGAAINPISTYGGQQYDVAFMIWKDLKSKDWWLRVGNEVMGYWPRTLFTDLQDHATTVEYGGEVSSELNFDSRHTTTGMGSGHFQNEGFGKAAFIRNLEVVDSDNTLREVSNLNTFAESPNCYGVQSGYNGVWRNYIYFGGPGYNPNCP
ncbi:protein neprosin-like [Bidens hawaiensis]|uniref:protein neprosin-like n=1 Tax=Bidens hawaiensis TaxID=980011 RepID=UPI00404940A9